MSSRGPATERRSLVEDVEFGPSDHSSALQLLSLGKPRTTPQQSPVNQGDAPSSLPKTNTTASPMEHHQPLQHHDSPIATHGRNRKKRRMLEAQAAANAAMNNSLQEDNNNNNNNNRNNNSSSHTQAAMALGDLFGAATSIKKEDSKPDSPTTTTQTVSQDKDLNGVNNETNGNDSMNNTEHTESKESETESPVGHKRRSGSRRHAALPLNRQKKEDTAAEGPTVVVESTPRGKKSKGGKRGSASKSSAVPQGEKEYVESPTDKDILLGMRKFNNHPGNEVYRDTVRKFQPEAKTKERAEVARMIIEHIYNVIGGKFLKIDSQNRWEVMPYVDVMTKVGKAIVELRNKASPAGKKAPKPAVSSVLESLGEGESQGLGGRRPKRKASMGRKVHDYTTSEITAPPSNHKKKRAKLPASEKTTAEGDTNPPKRIKKIVEVEQIYEEYIYKPDPNDYYVEETAHIYHNPPFPSKWTNGVTIEELRPIPPPPPLPSFPESDSCKWSFDETSRVLIADFSVAKNCEPLVTREDSKFLFEMQERTDITVISRGLLNMSKIDSSMWNLEYLRKCVGREFYHKFRLFDRIIDEEGIETYTEKDNLLSMRFEDYVDYCEKREAYMANSSTSSAAEEPTFVFEDHLGKMHSVGVGTSALYMIDVDMKRLTPLLHRNFLESFELPAVLPGGSHCMMNSVTPDARPFMGPNLYVTPPASFTHFHQDGHGTVDSGHLCISGFNEVVMLRRLTERHKKHALWILSGKKPGGFHFDGLYSMPHGDGLGEKPSWPKSDLIKECEEMGYCPSVFTLEPGDLVHINKGRLHAFRKMSTSKLPEWDCHAELRRNLIESKGIAGEEKLCVSVAWDWMYRGVTSEGINREVSTVLEASTLNRRNDVTSLAIPELSLLQMAKSIPARSLTTKRGISFLGALEKKEKKDSVYESTKEDICKGIYPGLCIVVGQHTRALNVKESTSTEKGERLSIAKIPDTQENPQTCPLDPYGDSDFACKLCRKELSNVYFHCDGCEKLLSKDFNICRGCYLQGKFEIKVQMHPSNPKRHATLNHMGDNKFSRQSRCPCKNGPACNYCGFCLGCSCRCHTWFTMRTRLCDAADEEKLLQTVKDTATIKTALHSTMEDESTKYLFDRLKDAGDDELLNDDKNDDTGEEEKKEEAETNEDNGESLPLVTQKDNVKEEELPNDGKKDEAKANEDNGETLNGIKEENGDESFPDDSKKDTVKPNEDNGERSQSGIKKENGNGQILVENKRENGIGNTTAGQQESIREIKDDADVQKIEDNDDILI